MNNLPELVLFYLKKIYQQKVVGDNTMTQAQLQADLQALNSLLSAVSGFFPNSGTVNSVVQFLEMADQDPLLLDIILLVVNGVNNSGSNVKK